MNYLANYGTFENTYELNDAADKHIKNNQYELNDTDRDVFLMLTRYSVKYDGVAHLKVVTIANTIGKSRRTIQRSLKKLEELRMIERKEFMRSKSGGNGANIFLILPYDVTPDMSHREEVEVPTDNSVCDSESTSETINLLSNLNNTLDTEKADDRESLSTDKPSYDEVIKRSLRNSIPGVIYDKLAPFFSGTELYEVYGILIRSKASIDRNIRLEDHYDAYLDAFYNAVRLKKERKVRSFYGLLYTAWETVSSRISRMITPKKDIGILAYNPYL